MDLRECDSPLVTNDPCQPETHPIAIGFVLAFAVGA